MRLLTYLLDNTGSLPSRLSMKYRKYFSDIKYWYQTQCDIWFMVNLICYLYLFVLKI